MLALSMTSTVATFNIPPLPPHVVDVFFLTFLTLFAAFLDYLSLYKIGQKSSN